MGARSLQSRWGRERPCRFKSAVRLTVSEDRIHSSSGGAMRRVAIFVGVGVGAVALAACAGSGATVVTVTAPPPSSASPTAEGADPSASAASSQQGGPEPSASQESPPMLLDDEATDALVSSGDLKTIKRLKGMELFGVETFEAERDPEVTVKPSRCGNFDSLIEVGAPSNPSVGRTSRAFFVQEEPFGYVGQSVTPSAKAQSALEYAFETLVPQCEDYTKTTPYPFDTEVREKAIASVEWTQESGWPTLALEVQSTSRRSGNVGAGAAPTERTDWVLVTSVGANLVATSGTDQEGVNQLHALGVTRVSEAMSSASADGRSTNPASYRP